MRDVVAFLGGPLDHTPGLNLTGVPHPDPLHDSPGSQVVASGAGDHGLDPFVDTMKTPGVARVLGLALHLGPVRGLGAIPGPHVIVGLDDPQVGGTSRNGRLKTQARREPAVSGWLGQEISRRRSLDCAQRPPEPLT